jgi:hypothetical protein
VSGVWKDLWTSLRSVVGAVASAVAFGLALLGSMWDPGIKVPIGLIWLVVMVFVVISIVATAIKVAMDARRLTHGDLPRAVYVFSQSGAESSTDGPIILVMGRSRQFGVNNFATIYYEEGLGTERGEVIERAIGIGQVANIQENGRIQVRVLREVANHSELWQRIRNREMATLSRVVIKPSIDFNSVGIEVRFDERG